MYKISINKELFKDIQFKNTNILQKNVSKYWKKELFEPKIQNNKLKYNIKQINKLLISNGLGKDKPQLIMECNKVEYSFSKGSFEFYLGKILEEKNIEENYKDALIEELLKEKAQLQDIMNKDHLTGSYTKSKMQNDLSTFSKQSNASFLTAIFIDINKFKQINNDFGHETANKVLIQLCQKLKYHSKILNGEIYRYAGDRFLILCFIKKENLLCKLDDLKDDIRLQEIYHPKKNILVTVSMGIAFLNECFPPQKMIIKAEEALYKAKNKGINTIEFG